MNWVSKLSTAFLALMLIGSVVPEAQAGDGLLARLRSKICKAKCPPVRTCTSHCNSQPVCANPCETKCNDAYQKFACTCEKLRLKFPNNPEYYQNCMSNAARKRCLCIDECNSCGATYAMVHEEEPYICPPIPICPSPADCEANLAACKAKAALRKSASDPTEPECLACYESCINAAVECPEGSESLLMKAK